MRFMVPMLILMLAGCGGYAPLRIDEAKPAPSERVLAFQEKLPNSTSTVVVIREVRDYGSGCNKALYINDTLAGRLDAGDKAQFYVEPGEVLFKIGRDPYGQALCTVGSGAIQTQRETTLRPHETKYFRIFHDGANWDIQRTDP